jgi:glycosyltransferase involved in cell wall biosynthesis
MSAPVRISVVVPVLNEEESLPELYREVRDTLGALGVSWELLFVDDHSTDGSLKAMLFLGATDPHVRIVRFRRNFGQTAALSAGFEHARGEIVVTMDGDLQNDPADIPRLVSKLEEGYDIVAGWRKDRQDTMTTRRVPSLIANRLINLVTGTRIHDTGCTLKAFRSQIIKNLPIYAEQHRFLPAMSRTSGANVTEVVVNHRARRFGTSKYGLERAFFVLLDLFTIKMIAQFSHRPLHYFGLFSMPFAGIAVLFLFSSTFDWGKMQLHHEWTRMMGFIVLLFFLLAVYFVMLGLLSELAVTASGMHRRGVLDRIVATVVGPAPKRGPR